MVRINSSFKRKGQQVERKKYGALTIARYNEHKLSTKAKLLKLSLAKLSIKQCTKKPIYALIVLQSYELFKAAC